MAGRTRAFLHTRDGAIALQFAFLAVPLAVMVFSMIDVNRASIGKKDLQDALDAATLITARSNAVSAEEIQSIGAAALTAQLIGRLGDATLSSATFTADGPTLHAEASMALASIVANLWLDNDMVIGARSDVLRSINKLEIALLLDNTGSMAGSKLTNLKLAATDFVDQVAAAAPATLITPYFWPDEADNDNRAINNYLNDTASSGWSW